MAIWTEYTTKNVPEDEDTLMIYDKSGNENKQLPVSGMSEKIVNDATEKQLDINTQNKTIPGAFNELYQKTEDIITGKQIVKKAETVNGHTVNSDVPENAKFTDTVYDDAQVREDIGQLKEDLGDIKNTYAILIPPISNANVTLSYLDEIVTASISGISLFENGKPIFLNDSTYSFNGFTLDISSIPRPIGLIVGIDSNSYYYLACFHNSVGNVFKVNMKTNVYTSVVEGGYSGSGIVKISIDNFDEFSLKYSVYNNDGFVQSYTQDFSNYITDKKLGFIPYRKDEYIVKFPYEKKYVYKDFKEDTVIDTLLTKTVNKKISYNIKLVGDSITAGLMGTNYDASQSGGGELIVDGIYENIKGHCWANSFKKYLEEKFLGIKVKNFGINGATAEYIYKNIRDIVRSDDNLVIIMLGTNNRNNSGDINRLYANLQNIINYCKGTNKEIVLMSSIPASLENESRKSVMHMEDVDMIVGAIAKVNNVAWVSVFKMMKNYLENTGITLDSILADGLHPNDTGYDIMYKLITEGIGFSTPIKGYTWTPTVLSVD